jgi:hypothetical protein
LREKVVAKRPDEGSAAKPLLVLRRHRSPTDAFFVLGTTSTLPPMPPAHSTHQNLTDALVWLFETIVCAVIFSAFAGFLFGDIIGDSGWRPVFTFVSVWLLGTLCATIDVRHRRRKRLASAE